MEDLTGGPGVDWLILNYHSDYLGFTPRTVQFHAQTDTSVAVTFQNTTLHSAFFDVDGFEKYSITGTVGRDILHGGQLQDVFIGKREADSLFGYGGNDRLYGGPGDDDLRGGSGRDRLEGGDGDDQLRGGKGHDLLIGGRGDDVFRGGIGNDTQRGGRGDDSFWTGKNTDAGRHDGNDQFWGGSGADDFIFNNDFGRDVIRDFDANFDNLFLNGDLWHFQFLSPEQVVDRFASFYDGRVVFDFDDPLRVNNADSIEIIVILGSFTTDEIADSIVFW
ncbi:calcium-binding protein [Phaeobacter inhibens]|uniref:calcium-binding protein n=1 Tax=Phaeobacter inhibens TaxID=221822 RepID=UPI0013145538|nr:calcium-binding protein [Phaeobacter inhibens]